MTQNFQINPSVTLFKKEKKKIYSWQEHHAPSLSEFQQRHTKTQTKNLETNSWLTNCQSVQLIFPFTPSHYLYFQWENPSLLLPVIYRLQYQVAVSFWWTHSCLITWHPLIKDWQRQSKSHLWREKKKTNTKNLQTLFYAFRTNFLPNSSN